MSGQGHKLSIWVILLVGAIGATCIYYGLKPVPSAVKRMPAAVQPAATAEPLPAGPDVYLKLSSTDQKKLIATVVRFCSTEYHARSCIHYVVKCGRPCLADLSENEQKRVLADYKVLRQQLAMAPQGKEGR